MKKIIIAILSIIFSVQVEGASLGVDTIPDPMRTFYKGCLAMNDYLSTKNVESIESALTLLNPRKTLISELSATVTDGAALVERGDHAMYDYLYAKYLYEQSGALFDDKGLIRGMSDCYVETITVKGNSRVMLELEVYGNELFRMFAMCEPNGKVGIRVIRKNDLEVMNGTEYEDGMVSYLSWFIPTDDILTIEISNRSDEDKSIVLATN